MNHPPPLMAERTISAQIGAGDERPNRHARSKTIIVIGGNGGTQAHATLSIFGRCLHGIEPIW